MSEKPAPFRFNLRRSIYGWGCLAWATLAIAFLAFWVASLRTGQSDFDPIYYRGLDLSSDGGVFRIHNCSRMSAEEILRNSETADADNQRMRTTSPEDVAGQVIPPPSYKRALPGIEYRRFQYFGDQPIWLLSLSPLVPLGVTTLLAILFFYRYVVAGRRSTGESSKQSGAKLFAL